MKKFSENSVDRMTWRTIRSIELVWDINWKDVLNIWSLWGWFENRVFEKWDFNKLVWLDIPGKHIHKLQNEYNNNPKVEFIEWTVLEIPFPKNSFDVVALWEVIEHIPKWTELFALMEINRVLKKWWKLLLSTPHDDIRAKILDPIWYFWHRHYDVKNLEYLVSEAWFFDFHIDVRWWCYELITMILFYIFKWIFRMEIPFKNFFEKKRLEEFQKPWFTNIFLTAIKNRDS